jgi:crotonobetainyl-CoA:carnitine CoA-transferase CaiB-like acyl-CoA transferase
LAAVGLFETIEHPTEGTLVTTRFPVKFGASPAGVRLAPPNLGEHGKVASPSATIPDDAKAGIA